MSYRYRLSPPRYRFKYVKEYHYIIWCRVCREEFRPEPYDRYHRYLKLCETCRKEYHKKRYRGYYIPYFSSLPPERQQRVKKARYKAWKRWVRANGDKRRAQALASYHKNKHTRIRQRNAPENPQIGVRVREERGG